MEKRVNLGSQALKAATGVLPLRGDPKWNGNLFRFNGLWKYLSEIVKKMARDVRVRMTAAQDG